MTPSKLTALTKVIQEANPELMELSFGCSYLMGGSKYTVDGSNYVVDRKRKTVTITSICNHPKNTRCCGEYQNENDEPETHKIQEILGHPITLEHVLKAMQNHKGPIGIDINGHFLDCDDDLNDMHSLEEKWVLGLPLSLQSPATQMFLYELLVSK